MDKTITNVTIKPAHGGAHEVTHTCPTLGNTIMLAVLPTADEALLWLNTWWLNVQLGHSHITAFRLANQFVANGENDE